MDYNGLKFNAKIFSLNLWNVKIKYKTTLG